MRSLGVTRFIRQGVRAAASLAVAGLAFSASANAGSYADAAIAADVLAAKAHAEALLSQRYAALWARLPAGEREAFSARERHWLNSGRWQEKDACVAARGAPSGAACLADVTLQHALALPEAATARVESAR